MAQLKHIMDLDEIVTLYMLEQSDLTHKQVWEALTRLTDGGVKYTSNYIAALLYSLRKDKLIRQYQESKPRIIYSITEAGREELQSRLRFFGIYDNILHEMTQQDDLPKMQILKSVDYEESFGNFLEQSEYDNAENMIFALVRAAYKSGWCAAGGDPPRPQNPIYLLKKGNVTQ